MPPRLSGMNTAHPFPIVRRLGLALLLLTASATGFMALRYGLPGQPFAPPLTNLITQRELLVLHAVSAGLALMLGPWQFITRLREQRPRLHRALGWGYASSLLVGGLAALPLALQADGGLLAQVGFALLGLPVVGEHGHRPHPHPRPPRGCAPALDAAQLRAGRPAASR